MLVANRYQLQDPLGEGSMGAVYRAHDRLTGDTVALKRVLPNALDTDLTSPRFPENNLALAHEFQILASLRHPHIITVLDYGFAQLTNRLEEVRQRNGKARLPFYTMHYLAAAQPLHQAAQGLALAARAQYLLQLLQALVYLHRRGIVHRDLKPSNVLVVENQVKVLDFGLSVGRSSAAQQVAAGTITYMAPEVLQGKPASEASDLYAVGVIACQLFMGQLPHSAPTLQQLMQAIIHEAPQLASAPALVRPCLERLLAKDPATRYPDASAAIADLCQQLGLPLPPDRGDIRESFLQAAQFVGRSAEFEQLEAALKHSLAGTGSAWLVGGESGVGKSRLLNELRTAALINGMMVLQGQAVEKNPSPYHLWRDPLQRLVLATTLSDLEAGILQEIVPDISRLLERPIPPVPPLGEKAHQQRLMYTLTEVLLRPKQPILLLLEDLQWAEVEILKHLVQVAPPMMIVGSYRDDEHPTLPNHLPTMQVLKLARLSTEGMRELSASMLGEAGRDPEIVSLLQRETEGNTFFAIEVVRALAEKAGSLDQIEHITLPPKVFSEGIQSILERRLAQVSPEERRFLVLAAILGRQLDLKIMGQWLTTRLEDWLTVCANAAIIETADQQWRFSHDKLRDAILTSIPEAERPALHQQVAQTLETIYGENSRLHAAQLAALWQVAGNATKEGQYTWLAGEQAWQTSAYPEAIAFYERTLQLPTPTAPALILCQIGRTHSSLGDIARSEAQLKAALAQVGQDAIVEIKILNALGEVYKLQGNYEQMGVHLEQAIALAAGVDDLVIRAEALAAYGDYAWHQDQLVKAQTVLTTALELNRQAHHIPGEQICTLRLGIVAALQGDLPHAQSYFEKSYQLARQLGDRNAQSANLTNLGELARMQGNYALTRGYYQQALALHQEVHNMWGVALNLVNLGGVELLLNNPKAAYQYLLQALRTARQIQAIPLLLAGLLGLAKWQAQQGDLMGALAVAGFIEQHPASHQEIETDVRQFIASQTLTPEQWAAVREKSQTFTLEGLLDQYLQV